MYLISETVEEAIYEYLFLDGLEHMGRRQKRVCEQLVLWHGNSSAARKRHRCSELNGAAASPAAKSCCGRKAMGDCRAEDL